MSAACSSCSICALIGGIGRIELEHALVDIEGTPIRPVAIAAGRLELDDVGTEIGEDAAGEPAEPVRRIEDHDIREEHGTQKVLRRFSRVPGAAQRPTLPSPACGGEGSSAAGAGERVDPTDHA